MRIKWNQSIVDGIWRNDKEKALTIQIDYYEGKKEFCVVHGITLIDTADTLWKAKVLANDYIRTMTGQSMDYYNKIGKKAL